MNKVKEIEWDAFSNCTSLKYVSLPSTLTTIKSGAFYMCKSLTNITLPSNLTFLGSEAFMESGLISIVLPSSITDMGSNYGAFENCTSLKTATINVSVTELPGNLFKGCTALTTVKFSNTSPITKFDTRIFQDCKLLTSITLPPKLECISNYSFSNCTSLTNIIIPDSVHTIGWRAFENCNKISSINIPYGVKKIENYAFSNCQSLKNIYFTKSIQEIEEDAFENCSTSMLKMYGYSGTAAKYFAQDNGIKFIECTPVSSIKISGNTSVLKGSSIKLTATVSPTGAYNKGVKWTTSNPSVATVDSNGNVKGLKSGTVTIAATAKDGTGVKATYIVKVSLTELSYKDINVNHWAYSAVKYCTQNEIIKGENSNTFSPEGKLTRAQLVTILHRMEGQPYVSGKSKFKDVQNTNTYYYVAVKWASSKNIVSGYNNGNFGPNDYITREQLAVILNNYCKYKGKYKVQANVLGNFKDSNKISNFAYWGMRWATGAKVITGGNGMLNPQGTTTRAEVASMIYKYCLNIK